MGSSFPPGAPSGNSAERPPEGKNSTTLEVSTRTGYRVPNAVSGGGFAVLADIDVSWHSNGVAVGALGVTLRVAYSTELHLDAASLMQFGNQVAMHHAWPFLRERVRSLSSEMSLPVVLLPIQHVGTPRHHVGSIIATVQR
jgi:hypothetical protein